MITTMTTVMSATITAMTMPPTIITTTVLMITAMGMRTVMTTATATAVTITTSPPTWAWSSPSV
jgi:hypothetical protein